MSITVREALHIGVLRKAAVLAGQEGLSRLIESVTIMDTPDIARWLKGGEMLLANAYVIKDDPEAQIQLIRDLSLKKAAALVIKLHRYIEQLPPEMVRLANENNLPILEIPIDVAWIEIISPVLSEIHARSLKLLSYSKTVHEKFTNLVLEGGSIEDISHVLKELIGKDVHITRIENHIKTSQHLQQEVIPIKVSGRALGRIEVDVDNVPLHNEDLIAVEHAATVSALTFLKMDAVIEAERRYRNEFLSSLLDRTIKEREEVLTRAQTFNWDLSKAYTVFAIELENDKEDNIYENHPYLIDSIIELIKKTIDECIYLNRESKIILFIPENKEKYNLNSREGSLKIGELLYRQLANYYSDLNFFIGIGKIRRDIINIHESYHEAVSALRLRKSLSGTTKVTHFEDLGIYKLLYGYHLENDFIKFTDNVFFGLNNLKEDYRTILLSTLQAYFKYQGNINHTAKALVIHPNTLRYRLEKLKKLCNIDLKNNENRLEVQIALKIAELNNRF